MGTIESEFTQTKSFSLQIRPRFSIGKNISFTLSFFSSFLKRQIACCKFLSPFHISETNKENEFFITSRLSQKLARKPQFKTYTSDTLYQLELQTDSRQLHFFSTFILLCFIRLVISQQMEVPTSSSVRRPRHLAIKVSQRQLRIQQNSRRQASRGASRSRSRARFKRPRQNSPVSTFRRHPKQVSVHSSESPHILSIQ